MALITFLLICINGIAQEIAVMVKNDLDFDRKEVVAVKRKHLAKLLRSHSQNDIRIQKANSHEYLPLQWIDNDGDGKVDELLFVAEVRANETEAYKLSVDSKTSSSGIMYGTYSRFIPERSDDLAWENDKVAFRVYGPKGQQEALKGIPGSTLSSGVDIWLKRVSHPVIEAWYAGHKASPGYYHTDRGEGYDPYHVGASRGTGGSGIWIKDSLQVSENFIAHRIIATGQLRTVFELDYAPWGEFGVRETKRITLDVGSNFSKFEVTVRSDKKLPNYAVGITMHRNEGKVGMDKKKSWFRHWEKIDDAYIGEGIVTDPETIMSAFAYVSKTADQSNLLVLLKPNSKIVYYAGFAWQKSGQVDDVSEWDAMLQRQAQIIAHPLEVKI
ncbi:DUF4861 family protein [Flavobacterium sp.]